MDAAATEKFISYMPEDGQTFASAQALRGKKLFGTSYNYKSYSVFWRKEDDVEARKVLKALRIRPMARFDGADPIAPARAPDSGSAGSLDDGFGCLITMPAHRKLLDTGRVALSMLYD